MSRKGHTKDNYGCSRPKIFFLKPVLIHFIKNQNQTKKLLGLFKKKLDLFG